MYIYISQVRDCSLQLVLYNLIQCHITWKGDGHHCPGKYYEEELLGMAS